MHPPPQSTPPRHAQPRVWAATLLVGSLHMLAAAQTTALPPALAGVQKHGVRVVGPLPAAAGGLSAWAGLMQGNPVALYVTPDGQHVLTGIMLDSQGKEVNRDVLEQQLRPQLDSATQTSLESAHWVPDGPAQAPLTVYVFTDPNCPYCKKLWHDARPWVQAGKVQLRHILVGQLRADSAHKAAAVLESPQPVDALARMAGGAKSGALSTPKTVSEASQRKLAHNQQLMQQLGITGTPALLWRDAQGQLQMLRGAPRQLAEVLGPQP